MTSKSQQIANSALYLLPIAIGNLVPIVTLPIFTRLLSPEDFGAIALANAYGLVVVGLAGLGLPVAYERNFFEHRDGRARFELLYTVVAFAATAFLVSGIATWLFRERITGWLIGDGVYQGVLVWSFWSVAVVAIKNYYMICLRNSEAAGAFASYTIAERLLAAGLTVLLVAGMGEGAIGMVIGQLAASTAVLALLLGRFFRQHRPVFDRRMLRDALKLGLPLTPRIAFGVAGNNVDKYLIGQIASLGGVGIYSIGQRVANIAFTYMTALQNVYGPQVYARMFSGDPDAPRSIGRYLTPFAYVSTVLAFLIGVFSEEILTILAPAEFRPAVPIVTILAVYIGIQFFGKLPQIVYAKKTHWISILAAITTALNLAFGAAGVWWLGTIGAAWGTLATGCVAVSLTVALGQRCYRIDWEVGKMVAIFGLFFACAFLTVGLRTLELPYAVRLGAKIASTAAFLALGAKLEIITVDNIALVRDIVLRRRAAI